MAGGRRALHQGLQAGLDAAEQRRLLGRGRRGRGLGLALAARLAAGFDTGRGIHAADRERIFMPFEKVSTRWSAASERSTSARTSLVSSRPDSVHT